MKSLFLAQWTQKIYGNSTTHSTYTVEGYVERHNDAIMKTSSKIKGLYLSSGLCSFLYIVWNDRKINHVNKIYINAKKHELQYIHVYSYAYCNIQKNITHVYVFITLYCL